MKFCTFNKHNFTKNVHNSLSSKYTNLLKNVHYSAHSKYIIFQKTHTIHCTQPTQVVKECILFLFFNIHNILTNVPKKNNNNNIHNFSKNVQNFEHSTNTISLKIYIILYIQSMNFSKIIHNSTHSTYTIWIDESLFSRISSYPWCIFF